MKLVEAPVLRPFTCVDGSQNGPLVDTLITHRMYGRMYWPTRLVVEAARLLGMVDKEAAAETEAQLAAARKRLVEVEGELAELQPVAAAIGRAATAHRWDEAA